MTFPAFYDPSRCGDLYIERAGLVAAEADGAGVAPASDDRFRIAAFGIDCQVGFCVPGASLFVPGAVEDTRRSIEWIYRNLETITGLHFSLDTHSVYQIFHPAWWRDASGAPPAPLTPITAADVRSGRWVPREDEEDALEYCEALEASGRYVLTIWPYHTLLGGLSHALAPALMEAAIYHAVARGRQVDFRTKGTHPNTENYSVLSPEVTEVGGRSVGAFDDALFDALMAYDRVYVFGQASSHCVRATLMDLRDRLLATDPSAMGKIWILKDAMSPVPAPPLDPLPPTLDFPRIAAEALAELEAAGMRVVTTEDPVEPGA